MALGKVQQQIIAKLEEMDRLSSEQEEAILGTPGDLTGEALDKLLQDEYKITDFQLLVAKARAHGLSRPQSRAPWALAPVASIALTLTRRGIRALLRPLIGRS